MLGSLKWSNKIQCETKPLIFKLVCPVCNRIYVAKIKQRQHFNEKSLNFSHFYYLFIKYLKKLVLVNTKKITNKYQ